MGWLETLSNWTAQAGQVKRSAIAKAASRMPLRLYVVYHPEFPHGDAIAEAIATQFDSLGMARDGVHLSVPVRTRSAAWDGNPGAPPRSVEFDDAEITGIILLTEHRLLAAASDQWRDYFINLAGTLRQNQDTSFAVNVALSDMAVEFPQFRDTHALRDRRFSSSSEMSEPAKRWLLIQLINRAGLQMKIFEAAESGKADGKIEKAQVFLSYARRDGQGVVNAIRHYFSNEPFGIQVFVDTHSLIPGRSYKDEFKAVIPQSAFVAVYTDAYGTRPFCRWEMLTAKRHRRPILVANKVVEGEQRSFPYAGNSPMQMVPQRTASNAPLFHEDGGGASGTRLEQQAIEDLILEVLSEVLRCLVWSRRAKKVCQAAGMTTARLLPRPPELADLAFFAIELGSTRTPAFVIYPDPPLCQHETELIDALRGSIEFFPLSALEGRL